MTTRRAALLSALTLAACGREAARGSGSAAAAPLRVGTYKGQDETLFPAAGQPTAPYRWSEFASGNLITEAILAGALDVGSMSDIPPVFVASQRPDLRLIAVLRGDVNNQMVLVPKDSPIRSSADLRGKRIGYVKATTSHLILLKLLDEQRLKWGDIQPVALSPQDGRAAFERGSLDAWIIYGPAAQLARQATGARLLTTGLGRLSGNYVIAASAAAVGDSARRAAIGGYLKSLRAVYGWAEAHPNDWARAISGVTGVPAAVYLEQRRERSAPSVLGPVDAQAVAAQQDIADVFNRAGLVAGKVNVAGLWDRTFTQDLS